MDDDTYEQLLDEAEADGLLKVIHVAYQPFNSKSWKSIPVGLAIVFASDPVLESGENATWVARLVVKTGNIVGLMKGGFHWSSKNVHSEASHFDMKVNDPELSRYERDFSRTFYLSDSRTPVSWTAKFEVAANESSDLARFKINDLELGQIQQADAWNTNGQLIYHYRRHDQNNNFNAIYDDLPLEGWWPWPKQNEQAVGTRRTREVGKSVMLPRPTEFTVVVAIVIVVAVAIVVVVVFAVAAVVAVIFYRQIEELNALGVKSKGTLPG